MGGAGNDDKVQEAGKSLAAAGSVSRLANFPSHRHDTPNGPLRL